MEVQGLHSALADTLGWQRLGKGEGSGSPLDPHWEGQGGSFHWHYGVRGLLITYWWWKPRPHARPFWNHLGGGFGNLLIAWQGGNHGFPLGLCWHGAGLAGFLCGVCCHKLVIVCKFSVLLGCLFSALLPKESWTLLGLFCLRPLAFLGSLPLQHPVQDIWGKKKIQGTHHCCSSGPEDPSFPLSICLICQIYNFQCCYLTACIFIF